MKTQRQFKIGAFSSALLLGAAGFAACSTPPAPEKTDPDVVEAPAAVPSVASRALDTPQPAGHFSEAYTAEPGMPSGTIPAVAAAPAQSSNPYTINYTAPAGGGADTIPAYPAASARPLPEDGAEALTQAPVHEAFAEPHEINPAPGIVVNKRPPEPIDELPPESKPQGAAVTWISGYWAWDADRMDFIWISGIWRDMPPGRAWVTGQWSEVQGGWTWEPGYWTEAQAQSAPQEVEYYEQPPESLESGPSSPAPGDDYVWTTGSWVWYTNRYAWRPGRWIECREDRVWSPAHYVCTPRGYHYVSGYWDYNLEDRGVLFAPVYVRPGYYGTGYYYSPSVVISASNIRSCLFISPRSRAYCYGDYYGDNYYAAGYRPWFWRDPRAHCYDPIYAQQRWHYTRHDRDWEDRWRRDYDDCRRNSDRRPPRTWREMNNGHGDWGHDNNGNGGGNHGNGNNNGNHGNGNNGNGNHNNGNNGNGNNGNGNTGTANQGQGIDPSEAFVRDHDSHDRGTRHKMFAAPLATVAGGKDSRIKPEFVKQPLVKITKDERTKIAAHTRQTAITRGHQPVKAGVPGKTGHSTRTGADGRTVKNPMSTRLTDTVQGGKVLDNAKNATGAGTTPRGTRGGKGEITKTGGAVENIPSTRTYGDGTTGRIRPGTTTQPGTVQPGTTTGQPSSGTTGRSGGAKYGGSSGRTRQNSGTRENAPEAAQIPAVKTQPEVTPDRPRSTRGGAKGGVRGGEIIQSTPDTGRQNSPRTGRQTAPDTGKTTPVTPRYTQPSTQPSGQPPVASPGRTRSTRREAPRVESPRVESPKIQTAPPVTSAPKIEVAPKIEIREPSRSTRRSRSPAVPVQPQPQPEPPKIVAPAPTPAPAPQPKVEPAPAAPSATPASSEDSGSGRRRRR